MLTLECSGTPYEIGHAHGYGAEAQIRGSIAFYQKFFKEKSSLDWEMVVEQAEKSLPTIQREAPHLLEEMKGIAEACHLPFTHIIALNVRTELAYGLAVPQEVDGCTAIFYSNASQDGTNGTDQNSSRTAFLAQNWDWRPEQAPNLIRLIVGPEPESRKPVIDMITEAGLIGKIGINSNGLGVCLNAIKARGVDWEKIPVHIALRLCLESDYAHIAARRLEDNVAAACNIFIADIWNGIYVECSRKQCLFSAAESGWLIHTNHYVLPHDQEIVDEVEPSDSKDRLERATLLTDSMKSQDDERRIWSILKDRQGAPGAIFRSTGTESELATLFSIVMDLGMKTAEVMVGQPGQDQEQIRLNAARVF